MDHSADSEQCDQAKFSAYLTQKLCLSSIKNSFFTLKKENEELRLTAFLFCKRLLLLGWYTSDFLEILGFLSMPLLIPAFSHLASLLHSCTVAGLQTHPHLRVLSEKMQQNRRHTYTALLLLGRHTCAEKKVKKKVYCPTGYAAK